MLHVLVADDHAPCRRAASTLIAAAPGFRARGRGRNGERAVELAAALDPDIVLLDVSMPRPHELPDAARSCGAAASVDKADLGQELLVRFLGQVHQHRLDPPADVLLPRDPELGED